MEATAEYFVHHVRFPLDTVIHLRTVGLTHDAKIITFPGNWYCIHKHRNMPGATDSCQPDRKETIRMH